MTLATEAAYVRRLVPSVKPMQEYELRQVLLSIVEVKQLRLNNKKWKRTKLYGTIILEE